MLMKICAVNCWNGWWTHDWWVLTCRFPSTVIPLVYRYENYHMVVGRKCISFTKVTRRSKVNLMHVDPLFSMWPLNGSLAYVFTKRHIIKYVLRVPIYDLYFRMPQSPSCTWSPPFQLTQLALTFSKTVIVPTGHPGLQPRGKDFRHASLPLHADLAGQTSVLAGPGTGKGSKGLVGGHSRWLWP